jgi:phage terminase large subunit-like protein
MSNFEGRGTARSVIEMVKAMRQAKDLYENSGTGKWFVPGTPFSLDRCKKHKAFFTAGLTYPERLFMAGNRSGKSVSGAVESAMHATGIYESWWPGRRFDRPTKGWACGDTSQTVRDTVQKELLGPPGALGTGTIPRDCIIKVWKKQGTSNGYEMVEVKHVSGGTSIIGFKSYEQGRKAFQGTAQDWIWLDEECPEDVYSECLIRTMTTQGMVYVTFTPLSGVTPFIVNFMKNADLLEGARPIMTYDGDESDETTSPFELPKQPLSLATMDLLRENEESLDLAHGRAVVQAGWADAPWLGEDMRARMAANCPPHLLEARMHGYPSIGSGNVYPVPLEEITCDPFPIPSHWKHMYALDVGWTRTAVLWAAQNPEDNKIYIYSEHYQGDARPEVHASAIKHRGEWIRGVVDPAARQRSQKDGEKLISIYRSLGLKIIPANNEVESGVYNTWGGLSGGRIKIFKNLTNFQKEYVVYARDDKGKIIKANDHLMDCLRYITNNIHVAMQQPASRKNRGASNGAGKRYDI